MTDLTGWLGPAHSWVEGRPRNLCDLLDRGPVPPAALYVYHQEASVGSPEDRAWIEREARVRSIIFIPAMIIVWILGLMLAFDIGAWSQAGSMPSSHSSSV